MAKGKISLSDFPVAERRKRSIDLDKVTASPRRFRTRTTKTLQELEMNRRPRHQDRISRLNLSRQHRHNTGQMQLKMRTAGKTP